jgi:DNA-binding transcriptional MerR regulator
LTEGGVRVDEDRTLTAPAAAGILDVSPMTVRRYADEGLLRSKRATVRGHRRVSERSVRELAAVLSMEMGVERGAALEALRRRNLGLPGDDPADPEQAPVEPEPVEPVEPAEGE